MRTFPGCLATFPGMFEDIPQNVWWHSSKCLVTFLGMFGDIPRSVWGHSAECLMTFPGMFEDTPLNVWRYFPECLATFPLMSGDIPQNITFLTLPAFPVFCSLFLYSWFYTLKSKQYFYKENNKLEIKNCVDING